MGCGCLAPKAANKLRADFEDQKARLSDEQERLRRSEAYAASKADEARRIQAEANAHHEVARAEFQTEKVEFHRQRTEMQRALKRAEQREAQQAAELREEREAQRLAQTRFDAECTEGAALLAIAAKEAAEQQAHLEAAFEMSLEERMEEELESQLELILDRRLSEEVRELAEAAAATSASARATANARAMEQVEFHEAAMQSRLDGFRQEWDESCQRLDLARQAESAQAFLAQRQAAELQQELQQFQHLLRRERLERSEGQQEEESRATLLQMGAAQMRGERDAAASALAVAREQVWCLQLEQQASAAKADSLQRLLLEVREDARQTAEGRADAEAEASMLEVRSEAMYNELYSFRNEARRECAQALQAVRQELSELARAQPPQPLMKEEAAEAMPAGPEPKATNSKIRGLRSSVSNHGRRRPCPLGLSPKPRIPRSAALVPPSPTTDAEGLLLHNSRTAGGW